MTPVELALEKQRLKLAAAAQRAELARNAAGLQPMFHAVDQVRSGARWVARHPEIAAAGVALLVAIRPGIRRFLLRAGRRGFLAWLWLRHDGNLMNIARARADHG